MPPIRILFFEPSQFLGPEMTVYSQIIRHLDRARFVPHLVVNSRAGDNPRLTQGAATTRRWDFGCALRGRSLGVWAASLRLPLSITRLVRHVKEEGIEIIHCSATARAATLGLIVARCTGARLLLHFHVLPCRFGGLRNILEGLAARRADQGVAVSRFVAREAGRTGMRPERIHAVLNRVDLGTFHPDAEASTIRQEYGIPEDAPLVLQLGRLYHSKRQEDTVRAVAMARSVVPSLRCLIIGWEDDRYTGPFPTYRAELQHICEAEDLDGAVTIARARADAPALMSASDIVVMPALGEAFGLVVAEALATGRPVVGANSGGLPELVTDGQTGFLVPPRSPGVLAEKIVALAKDAELRRTMGLAARRYAEEHLDDSLLAQELSSIYETMVQPRVESKRTAAGEARTT